MPARDKYHDVVIRALEKDGWQILDDQYGIFTDERNLWIDLLVSKAGEGTALLVEINSFISRSFIEDLANAIGKYVLYSAILELAGNDYKLYLAIPRQTYETLQAEDIGEIVFNRLAIPLVVYDPQLEVIIQWIN